MEKKLDIDGRAVTLLLPEDAAGGELCAVYIHLDAQRAAEVAAQLLSAPAAIVAIEADWERELSPWPAGRAFKGGADFTGGAKEYLTELTGSIIPAAEKEFSAAKRVIAGYSLAGLFAVYAALNCRCYSGVASISGSLWYDGFMEYAEGKGQSGVPDTLERAYLSLGERESATRNQSLAAVGECTQRAALMLEKSGVKTVFELNPGGHFDDVTARIARGISALL